MIKTGNIYLDLFNIFLLIIPLLPVLVILIRKNYRLEVLNFLMIICLLNFIRGVLQTIDEHNNPSTQQTIKNIFSLFDFLFLVLISRGMFNGKLRQAAILFISIYLSIFMTIRLFQGFDRQNLPADQFQDLLILGISLFCILILAQTDNLQILTKPLFWISIGSLFYFSIAILMQGFGLSDLGPGKTAYSDNDTLWAVNHLARYFFYFLAAILSSSGTSGKEGSGN